MTPLDEPASRQFVINALSYVIQWSTEYMEAARMGDEEKMKRLNEEWDPESLLEETTE
jgi:hypothetical protein